MMKLLTALLINLVFVSNAFAMAGQGGGGGKEGGSLVGLLLPMVIVFAIFYFLLIRPQQKQQKKTKEMIESMKSGDEVMTRGGIYGRIKTIADNIVTLEIASNVKIRINKESIGVVIGKEILEKK